MGTRNLTMVYLDGEYKVAQYGQYDGYPSGQGLVALEFARMLQNKDTLNFFKRKVRAAKFADFEYLESIGGEKLPEINCCTSAGILEIVLNHEDGIVLYDSIGFAADSLMCEWGWLIDLDNNTFCGYKGLNTEPLTENDDFYFLKDLESDCTYGCEGEEYSYHGIVLAGSWMLDVLPSDEEFLEHFEKYEQYE